MSTKFVKVSRRWISDNISSARGDYNFTLSDLLTTPVPVGGFRTNLTSVGKERAINESFVIDVVVPNIGVVKAKTIGNKKPKHK